MKAILQGEIYLADLNPVKGHEQGGFRAVLVLQNNILSKNLSTVVVASLTTNLKAKGFLTTYFLPKKLSKLPHDSVVLLYQIRTLDRSRLAKRISHLDSMAFNEIKRQLALIF